MNRFFTCITIAALLTGATMTTAQAAPRSGRWIGPCSTWREGETLIPADWHGTAERRAIAVMRIKRLIVCVFARWAPGQSGVALYVADRESSFYPWAQNVSSLCSGLFQHILSAWPARAHSYLQRSMWARSTLWPDAAHPERLVFDPRANAIAAARMVAASGWGPWSM